MSGTLVVHVGVKDQLRGGGGGLRYFARIFSPALKTRSVAAGRVGGGGWDSCNLFVRVGKKFLYKHISIPEDDIRVIHVASV